MPAFALLVSTVSTKTGKARGSRPVRFAFDQERVLVGRGADADLRIEHAAVARAQFLVERGVGSAGEPRYRITPFETTNATYVNERPAVEGTLTPGDVIAVGDVRVVLERKVAAPADGDPSKKKKDVPPLRAILLGVTTLMALYVGYLLFSGDEGEGAGDLATAQVKLFLDEPKTSCGNPIECDTRAHDAYGRGKKLLAQAGADPGNLYRAAKELERASRFREQSGRPLADMADVDAQLDAAKTRAEAEFHDARFRLSRAIAKNDLKSCAVEAALLARIVPDERHPYRTKLDAYRRTLPRPGKEEPK
jgi:pSer/pThr/pTyr-binding forkhead associated (FHA) protein